MTDLRDKIARALYDSATSKARNESAHVASFEDAAGYFRATLTDQADAVLAVLDLDTERAKAWDEGHESAAMRVPECVWFDTAAPHPGNPYRKAEQ